MDRDEAYKRVVDRLAETEDNWTDDPYSSFFLAEVILDLMAEAWDEGHSAGWEDANDAYHPQSMGSFNPYQGESHE